MTDALTNTDHTTPGTAGSMERAVARVAEHLLTGRAVAALLMAAYDAVTAHVHGPQRKPWGRARQLLTDGWDDLPQMEEAATLSQELADQLVTLTERLRDRQGGVFVAAIVALSHLAVAVHAARRRVRELRAAQVAPSNAPAAPENGADASVGHTLEAQATADVRETAEAPAAS